MSKALLSGIQHRISVNCLIFAALAMGVVCPQSVKAQCVPNVDPGCHSGEFKDYYVERIDGTPPTIDAVVSPGEWDEAVDVGGNWHLLRTGTTPETATPDSANWRFRALWDDLGLYLLIQGDRPSAGWDGANDSDALDWNLANVNIYVDPNTDGELQQRVDGDIDNYHVAYNIRDGFGYNANAGPAAGFPLNFGQFEGVSDNSPFENNSWKLTDEPTFTHAIATYGGATDGILEMFWPWEGFNAVTTNDPGNGGLGGLPHAYPAVVGEEWLFNIYTNTGDSGGNWLPIWNWQDTQSATFQPPGLLHFVDGGIPNLPGDGNGDGWVDGLDYLLWASNFGSNPGPDGDISDGDYNDDGSVDGLDYLLWAGNFGNHSASAAVPEPGTLVLACVALFSAVVAGRRRR
ncbi:MAG: PEP-CTERM sorting domain-containing protein [Pirellulales bacterium]